MCPHNKFCALSVTGVIVAQIIACPFEERCDYVKREPDVPEKTIPYFSMPQNAVVVASGSQIEVDPRWGELIGKIEDGRSLYFVKPQEIEKIGHFTIVNSSGNKTTIDLTLP